ncbi:MAG: 8-amino-7-oxononanoate synthase [Armatimonadota bacterium]
MPTLWDAEFERTLEDLRARELLRTLRTVGRVGPRAEVSDGEGATRQCVILASNDYLGLAAHPSVCEAAAEAARAFGAGAAASRLLTGNLPVHEELEAELAAFKGVEAALVFSSGYAANLGSIPALVGSGDVILCDKLSHASIVDACRLSGARLRVYRHKDLTKLEDLLKRCVAFRRRLIVTDGVFSMDGDLAPLPEILELADRYGAVVMVDDAHGGGVVGPMGRGTTEHLGVDPRRLINMGTLSKAFGAQGGYVAGSRALVGHLRNRARAFVYSTGLAPPAAAAALAALRLASSDPSLRAALWANVRALREALGEASGRLLSADSHVTCVLIGAPEAALRVAARAFEEGLFVPAIRPPTVPQGTSRLRVTATAAHTLDEARRAGATLAEIAHDVLPD